MAKGINFNLDTTKSEFQNPMVELRQGDGNYQSLHVTVTSNGEPLDLTGWTITFMGTTNGLYKIVDSSSVVENATQGTFNYTPTKAWGQDMGEYKKAYFKFTNGDKSASSADFRVTVFEAVDLTEEEAGDYISVVDQLIDKVKTDMDNKLSETNAGISKAGQDLSNVKSDIDGLNSDYKNIKESDNEWSGSNKFDEPIAADILGNSATSNNSDYAKKSAYADEANDGNAIHVDKFGDIESFLPKEKETFIPNLNNEFIERGINVKWYGAKGDRVTDDTQAFNSAIYDASQSGRNVFVPNGKYIISENIELEYINIIGESRENTFVFGKDTDYIFTLGNGVHLFGFTVLGSLNEKKLTAIKIGKINSSSGGGSIKNINFKGVAQLNDDGTVQDIGFTGIEIGEQSTPDNLTGIFPYAFGDIQFFDVTDGIIISPQAYNFFNGNHFDNIIVQGYVHSGLWFKKTENSNAISQNYFNDLQIQAKSYTSDSSGAIIIQHGINNYFNFLHTWTDGNKPVPSLVINGDLQTDKTKINSNIFSNCILESGTSIDDIYKGLNTFKNIIFNDWLSKDFPTEVTSTKGKLNSCKKNILSGDLIEKMSTPLGTLLSTASEKIKTIDFDNKGYYLNVSSTSTNHLIYLNINKIDGEKLRKFGIVSAGFVFDTNNPKTLIPQVKIIFKNSSTGATFECPSLIKQIGKTTNGSYILRSAIDVSNVDSSYNLVYFVLYNRAANDIKIRELQLVDGYYSVNNTIYSEKANYYRNVGTVASPASFTDIGITNMYQTNLISNNSFDKNLLTVTSINNLYYYEYKIYV